MIELSPELSRIQRCILSLNDLRFVFQDMEDDGERERAWDYLRSLFGEYDKSEMPHWENVEEAVAEEAGATT